eukprot:UC4_evm5s102
MDASTNFSTLLGAPCLDIVDCRTACEVRQWYKNLTTAARGYGHRCEIRSGDSENGYYVFVKSGGFNPIARFGWRKNGQWTGDVIEIIAQKHYYQGNTNGSGLHGPVTPHGNGRQIDLAGTGVLQEGVFKDGRLLEERIHNNIKIAILNARLAEAFEKLSAEDKKNLWGRTLATAHLLTTGQWLLCNTIPLKTLAYNVLPDDLKQFVKCFTLHDGQKKINYVQQLSNLHGFTFVRAKAENL